MRLYESEGEHELVRRARRLDVARRPASNHFVDIEPYILEVLERGAGRSHDGPVSS